MGQESFRPPSLIKFIRRLFVFVTTDSRRPLLNGYSKVADAALLRPSVSSRAFFSVIGPFSCQSAAAAAAE